MRICVFSPDIPFPPNRGGRVDVLRRLLAMRRLGHEVLLLTSSTSRQAGDLCSAREFFRENGICWEMVAPAKGVSAIWNLFVNIFRTPLFVSRRLPDWEELSRLSFILKQFAPSVLWSEGPWLWPLVMHARKLAGGAVGYRSHNIEHIYMRGQRKLTPSFAGRCRIMVSFLGLKSAEQRCMEQADAIFDISIEDLNWWGKSNSFWLPPLVGHFPLTVSSEIDENEFVFVGNLGTPNNIAGVLWLARTVLPLIRQRVPNAVFRVAGSSPAASLKSSLEELGCVVDADVPDIFKVMQRAGVLVNPVMVGSGVQLKMLDMLLTDRPIVSTSQGLRGLPPEVRLTVEVADSSAEFAEGVIRYLNGPANSPINRKELRNQFSDDAVSLALGQLVSVFETRTV